MTQKRWYLIAYDIRERRRLQRVHGYLKKRAWMMQRSVYLMNCDRATLQEMETELRRIAEARSDDIRLYPISSPQALWEAGPPADALVGVFPRAGAKRKRGRLARLFDAVAGRAGE